MLVRYVETIRGWAPLLPANSEDLEGALLALELEKALYELTYELGNRPELGLDPALGAGPGSAQSA